MRITATRTPDASRSGGAGMSPRRFEGRTAFVTGAGSGIGEAVARALHGEGARVTLADLSSERVQALAGALGDDRALACALDVRDEDAVRQALRRGRRRPRQRRRHRVDDHGAGDAARGLGGRVRGQRARDLPDLQARHPVA